MSETEYRNSHSPNDEKKNQPSLPLKENNVNKEIELKVGQSSCILSPHAQQYLTLEGVSSYESDESILIVQEPHSSSEGQFNLYKGLEIFFEDNPELVKKTIFLSEGLPTGESISIQPLINEEPTPGDELIKQVLDSLLITGYMAYEWKHKQGIPIVGTEDKYLYALCKDYALKCYDHPNEYFFSGEIEEFNEVIQQAFPDAWATFQKARPKFQQNPNLKGTTIKITDTMNFTLSDKIEVNLTNESAWYFLCVARNLDIMRTLLKTKNQYENPMLFVGFGHLFRQPQYDLEFNILKLLSMRIGPFTPFGERAMFERANALNYGIVQYLRLKKIGFSALNPKGIYDENKEDDKNYQKLFEIQKGDRSRINPSGYTEYIDQIISEKK